MNLLVERAGQKYYEGVYFHTLLSTVPWRYSSLVYSIWNYIYACKIKRSYKLRYLLRGSLHASIVTSGSAWEIYSFPFPVSVVKHVFDAFWNPFFLPGRIFLALDPKFGELSPAMRNRGVEIHVDPEFSSDSLQSVRQRLLLSCSEAPRRPPPEAADLRALKSEAGARSLEVHLGLSKDRIVKRKAGQSALTIGQLSLHPVVAQAFSQAQLLKAFLHRDPGSVLKRKKYCTASSFSLEQSLGLFKSI